MVEFTVINSFHNHDSLFYSIKPLKSIPGLSLEIPASPGFNRDFNLLSPMILLYCHKIFSIIAEFSAKIIRYISIFFSTSKKGGEKNFKSMLTGAGSCLFYPFYFFRSERCINTVEPAAVLVFPMTIKVVEEIRPESAAAGHFEVKCKNKAKQKKEDKK